MRGRILWIVYGVVVLLMMWVGFDFYRAYTSSAAVAPLRLALDEPSPPSREVRHPFSYYAVIGERHLFCRDCLGEDATSSPGQATPEPPEEGPLAGKLRLLGTAVAQDGEDYAVLEHVPTREQRLCKVGDAAKGIEIVEIKPNSVTVRYGARLETISYVPEEAPPRPTGQRRPGAGARELPGEGYSGRAISRDEMAKCAETMDSLLTGAGAEVFAKDGEPYGVRVARVDVRSCLGQMGLRSGDIILSVNEKAVTSIEDAADAFAALAGQQGSNVRVDRNGWARSLNVEIR